MVVLAKPAAIAALVALGAVICSCQEQGLVAHYSFNEGHGSIVRDPSGNRPSLDLKQAITAGR